MITTAIRLAAATGILVASTIAAPVHAAPTVYGCFVVTADQINIRSGAFSNAEVVGTAAKGQILIKRKRFCTLRGFWCAVRKGKTEGWADKAFMTKVDCPKRLKK